MSKQRTPVIVKDNLAAHPAVLAWFQLRADTPREIELIRGHTKSSGSVFRLAGVGDNDGSVFAKKDKLSRAMIERSIYEKLPIYLSRTLHYYGYVMAENNSSWIFTEDAGGDPFSFENTLHTSIAIDWLAELHTSVPKFDTMPNRGLDTYHSHLISAHNMLRTNLSNKDLRDTDIALLKSIILHLDYLMKQWHMVYSLYEQLPEGLIHGDFKKKNLHVRTDRGKTLFVFDWAEAGWGLPGVDMCELNTHDYWLKVQDHWHGATFETIVQLSRLGKLLRCLSAIDWAAKELPYQWLEKPLARMQSLRRAFGWRNSIYLVV